MELILFIISNELHPFYLIKCIIINVIRIIKGPHSCIKEGVLHFRHVATLILVSCCCWLGFFSSRVYTWRAKSPPDPRGPLVEDVSGPSFSRGVPDP